MRHVHYTSTTPSTSTTGSRYNRSAAGPYSSSYMHSPTTNTATYSSYLLGKSDYTASSSPSRRYNRYTASTSTALTDDPISSYKSTAVTSSRPIRSYRGTKSNQELTSSLLDGITTSSACNNYPITSSAASHSYSSSWRSKSASDSGYRSAAGISGISAGSALSRSTLELSDGMIPTRPPRDRSITRNSDLGGYTSTSTFRDRDLSLSRPDTSMSSSYRERYNSGSAAAAAAAAMDTGANYQPLTDFDPHPVPPPVQPYRDRSLAREPLYSPVRDNYPSRSRYGAHPAPQPQPQPQPPSMHHDHHAQEPPPLMMNGFETSMGGYQQQQQHQHRNSRRDDHYSNGNRGGGHLVRSNSYRDIRDYDQDYMYAPTAYAPATNSRQRCSSAPRRARHQTLAYGVSAEDLGMARNTVTRADLEDWHRRAPMPLAPPGPYHRGGAAGGPMQGFASEMSCGGGPSMVSRLSFNNEISSSSVDAGYSTASHSRRGSTLVRWGLVDCRGETS